jgi:Flp pilus assembly protein TadB
MAVLAAGCLAAALLSLGLAIGRRGQGDTGLRRVARKLAEGQTRRLEQARIPASPQSFVVLTLIAPIAAFGIGWLESPVLAIVAGVAGLFAPRMYLAWLVHAQSRRSESEAGRFLQSLLASLTGGSTYLDALRHARLTVTDPWIREDLDFVIQRFMLNIPLHESMGEIRARIATRNLALIWETLAICTANNLPTPAARTLFFELSSTVQFNVQLASEVNARSAGQRAQIWLLAIIVPAMYLYLRLMSPQLLNLLDDTPVGRYLLFPAAAALEVTGIVLSLRIARFAA